MYDLFGNTLGKEVEHKSPKAKRLDRSTYKPKSPYSEKLEIIKGHKELKAGEVVTKRWRPVLTYRKKTEYQKSAPWESFIMEVLGLDCRFLSEYPMPQDRYWIYTQELGYTPKSFVRQWNACNCKVFIDQDVADIARKFCKKRLGWYDHYKIKNLNKFKDAIKQLKDDGMENIIPYVLNENISAETFTVKDFRKNIGKSAWKKLIKQSTSRNKRISQVFRDHADYRGGDLNIKDLLEYPTSLLPTRREEKILSKEMIPVAKKGRFMCDKEKVSKLQQTYEDLLRMERQLPQVRRPRGHTKWGFEDLLEWHDYLAKLILEKDYSEEGITWTKSYDLKEVTSENFIVHILESAFDIKLEGEAMKHCVGGYARKVENAEYLVISIRNKLDNTRFSTLGLYYDNRGFKFNQHYKQCNASVDNEEARKLAAKVISELNKQFKDLTKNKEK